MSSLPLGFGVPKLLGRALEEFFIAMDLGQRCFLLCVGQIWRNLFNSFKNPIIRIGPVLTQAAQQGIYFLTLYFTSPQVEMYSLVESDYRHSTDKRKLKIEAPHLAATEPSTFWF